MASATRASICQRAVGENPLPGYGPANSVDRPVRTRMRGGVEAGGEENPSCAVGTSVIRHEAHEEHEGHEEKNRMHERPHRKDPPFVCFVLFVSFVLLVLKEKAEDFSCLKPNRTVRKNLATRLTDRFFTALSEALEDVNATIRRGRNGQDS